MKFLLIDAKAKTMKVENHKDLKDAQAALGLASVDHGSLIRGLGYVVDEFGMFAAPDKQHYFAFGEKQIAGNCVMYGYADNGMTVDVDGGANLGLRFSIQGIESIISFFDGHEEIERDIERHALLRPQIKYDGKVIWQWPAPAPKGMGG